jgi:hypothetical protein
MPGLDVSRNTILKDCVFLFLREARIRRGQTEKEVPQPQERAELGLWKLNPWRMSVSS